jgi:hypothetical protein
VKRFAVAITLLQAAIRWSIWAAIVLTEPKTSDTVAHLMFGPARIANDFPRFFLPAIGLGDFHPLRFALGELFWAAAASAAAYAVAAVFRRR